MKQNSKVSGEYLVNCVIRGFQISNENVSEACVRSSELVGGPGKTRTCDPLLRRPIPAFSWCFRNVSQSRQTRAYSSVDAIFPGLTEYSQKQRFGILSGEQLVSFRLWQQGSGGPIDMRFFKHFTDAHVGRSMQSLMNQFGLEGYAAYFILMEMCAEKIDKMKDEELTEEHFKCAFSERIVREKLRMRSTKVELFLNSCATLVLLQFTKVQDEFHFCIPKLLESMDRDSKRARTERAQAAPKIKKKIKIKDKEIDKEKEPEIVSSFEAVYQIYPRREHKGNSLTRFKERIRHDQYDDFITAVSNYAAVCMKRKSGLKFTMLMTTFIGTDQEIPPWFDYIERPRELDQVSADTPETPESMTARIVREQEEYQKKMAVIYGEGA